MSDRDRDTETARRFYADLLTCEARMEAAGEQMHNRGRWLETLGNLRKARQSLQQFIGERMTADIEQEHHQDAQQA